MGFVRKLTGQQAQIDQAKRNAQAQEDAMKQSAQAAEANSMAAAKAAADAQAQQAARYSAEQKASDVLNVPLGQVDVNVDTDATSTGEVRRRRAKFGKGYSSGVQV